MKPKLIMFDLDGTLLDTSPGIFNGLNHLIEEMNLNKLDDDIMPDLIGPPLRKSYTIYFGLEGEDVDKASNIYRKYYSEKGHKEFKHYPEMEKLLKTLKEQGYKLAIVTMKEQRTTNLLVNHSGLDKYFDLVQGNLAVQSKTKADLIRDCLNFFEIEPEEALFIGDTSVDANGAEEAQVLYLPALYGFGYSHNDSIENSTYYKTLDHPLALLDILEVQE